MAQFIDLHTPDGHEAHLAVAHIAGFVWHVETGGSVIILSSGSTQTVRETPQEIKLAIRLTR